MTFNLSRIRLTVQLVMLVVTVYGGAVVGHYMADKISTALPALSCAFDNQDSGFCVLIPFQHQLHHRVGESIVRFQEFSITYLVPMGFTLLSFYLFFVVLGKAFCGWVCPLGTLQEILFKFGRYLSLPLNRIAPNLLGKVRSVKWLVLGFLVLLLPLLAGLGLAPHAAGDSYCQICPSRIATTLLTGDAEQLAVNTQGWADYLFGALRSALFGFVIIAAMAMRQPFCRICPMLALHALFRHFAFLRLTKKDNEPKCSKCGLCEKACPMDIVEIAKNHGRKAFHDDCTLCGRCAEFCPDDDIIALKFGPVPLFKSSSAYFRQRTAIDKPDGSLRPKRKAPTKSPANG